MKQLHKIDEIDSAHLLGYYKGIEKGPCIILVAGIHGNEPAGVYAAQGVLDNLKNGDIQFKGNFVALKGNISALNNKCRYIDRDLNRIWTASHINYLCQNPPSSENIIIEDTELLGLLECINSVNECQKGEVIVMDLHTSSAPGSAFVVGSHGHLLNRINKLLHVPVVIDTPGYLKGAMLSYLPTLGYPSFAFEAGQHESKESIGIHEAAIWLTLSGAGCVNDEDLPDRNKLLHQLNSTMNGIPDTLELVYRHAISKADSFKMYDGFNNFDVVIEGQPLGTDKYGEVTSPQDGRIFLPLYQEMGEDGFFIVEKM